MPLYYDISDVFEYALSHERLSGIQRTALNILCRLVNAHGASEIRLIAYHPKLNRMLRYDAGYFAGDYAFDQKSFCRHFNLYGSALGVRTRNRISAGLNSLQGAIGEPHLPSPSANSPDVGTPLAFVPGDVVFVAGATWGDGHNLKFLNDRRLRDGIKIFHMIYDIIPITMPEHVVEGLPEQFSNWLGRLSRSIDGFVAISHATKADLEGWLRDQELSLPVHVLPLCHQFGLSARTASVPGSRWNAGDGIGTRVRNAARMPFVLCVGTLESRKNVWTLANVWRRIYDRLGDATPRLIFAGSPGWLNDDFEGFLAGTGSLYGYISVVRAPSDAELAFLYRSCLFSAFVSYKEGWGLPIGEGLWFGRPVVCSNVSSMPEVGGSLADYADPTSPSSIEAAALRLITDAGYREQRASEIAQAKLRTWDDVAASLWTEMTSTQCERKIPGGPASKPVEMADVCAVIPAKGNA